MEAGSARECAARRGLGAEHDCSAIGRGSAFGLPPLQAPIADASWQYRIGFGALLGLSGLFLWHAPDRYGPAAAALAGALVLDAASRLAAGAVSRRFGLDVAMRGQPSLVLSLAGMPLLPAAGLALLALFGHDGLPLAASLTAGLLAMSALARLALTRHALGLARRERLTPP